MLSHVQLFVTPWTVTRILCPWTSPSKHTGAGCHSSGNFQILDGVTSHCKLPSRSLVLGWVCSQRYQDKGCSFMPTSIPLDSVVELLQMGPSVNKCSIFQRVSSNRAFSNLDSSLIYPPNQACWIFFSEEERSHF